MLSAVEGLRRRLGDSARAFPDVFRNPNLRRLELAWAPLVVGHWAFLVAVVVFAYGEGGAAAVGLLVVIRTFRLRLSPLSPPRWRIGIRARR